MKKLLILTLVLAVCLAAYAAWSFADGEYQSGGATITDAVESIRVEWTSGSVTVAYHDADTVILEETADRAIGEDDRLRWKTDGKTLVVEYGAPKLFSFFSPSKALTLTLPKSIHLKKAEITGTSADIRIPELAADEIVLGSTSGDVNAAVSAPSVSGESTSGDVTLTVNGRADRVKMGSTSGRLSLTLEEADGVELGTTSGGIRLEAESLKQAGLGSSSGNVSVKVKAFEQLKINTTSGDVNAEIPSDPGFTARISTSSGDFSSAVPLSGEGNTWSCGNGSAKLEISTTSGDIKLSELK